MKTLHIVFLLLISIAVLTLYSQDPNGMTLKDIQQVMMVFI